MRHLRYILAAALLSALFAIPQASAGSAEEIDFTLETVDGSSISLGRFRGEMPVLIVFWATWCPQCNAEIPAIKDVHSRMMGKLQILAIDFMESREKVRAFVNSKNITYPVLLDANGKVARKFRVAGIPTYVLLDRSGKVVFSGNALPGSIERYL